MQLTPVNMLYRVIGNVEMQLFLSLNNSCQIVLLTSWVPPQIPAKYITWLLQKGILQQIMIIMM